MTGLVVSGWATVAAAGIGAADFCETLAGPPPAPVDVSVMFEEPLPGPWAHALPDFRIREHLGRKGTSMFDRSTSLALVACGLALRDSDLDPAAAPGRVGVVLGTSTGSLKSTSDYTRETLTQDRPYRVNPMLFPNTVMNCAAGQAAIWFGLRGVNATVAGGAVAGLAALRYAANAIRRGYVDALLVGSVEEFSPQTAWVLRHSRPTDATPPGEGAAVLVVEAAGSDRPGRRPPDAHVLAVQSGCGDPPADGGPAGALAACIRRALQDARLTPDEVGLLVSAREGDDPLDKEERRGIAEVIPQTVRTLELRRFVGETGAASGSLQLAAALAAYRNDPALAGTVALVTSCTQDGMVAAALLRGGPGRTGHDRP